jgi:hypothetical protein
MRGGLGFGEGRVEVFLLCDVCEAVTDGTWLGCRSRPQSTTVVNSSHDALPLY